MRRPGTIDQQPNRPVARLGLGCRGGRALFNMALAFAIAGFASDCTHERRGAASMRAAGVEPGGQAVRIGDANGGLAGPAECPRNAARDPSGRCACIDGAVLVLGACVSPVVADSFCGRGALLRGGGCAFRGCGPAETIDVATGRCVPLEIMGRSLGRCDEMLGESLLVEDGRAVCVSADAVCPRGTRRAVRANAGGLAAARTEGAVCVSGPTCPAGSLPAGPGCRPVVFAGRGVDHRRVDVGSWLAIAFGVDGGFGSSDLCRPLLQRPALLGLPAARPRTVRIRVTLLIPDEDMSRLHARIDAWDPERRALSPEAVRAVDDAVGTLLEVMRGLGNESSTSALDAEVACPVSAEGIPGRPSSLP